MPVPWTRVEVGFATAPDDPVQSWTDVSADVKGPITCNRGRSDEFSDVEPGRATLTLDNTAGDYTFGNASGAHYPNVLPGKRIRVLASADEGETWVPRFDGYVDGWPTQWAQVTEQARVVITATDRLARFTRLRTLRDAVHEHLQHAIPDEVGFKLG